MTEGRWQLESSAAELFQRYLVPAITLKWAEDLVRRAQLRTGELVLDIACGTGVVARLAATKVRPVQVTGCSASALVEFIFDLMETERPNIDRTVLDFVKGHVFHPADFTIRSDGVCRLNPDDGDELVAKVSA